MSSSFKEMVFRWVTAASESCLPYCLPPGNVGEGIGEDATRGVTRGDSDAGPALLLLNAIASTAARWLSALFVLPVPASLRWNQFMIGLLERLARGFCCGLGAGLIASGVALALLEG